MKYKYIIDKKGNKIKLPADFKTIIKEDIEIYGDECSDMIPKIKYLGGMKPLIVVVNSLYNSNKYFSPVIFPARKLNKEEKENYDELYKDRMMYFIKGYISYLPFITNRKLLSVIGDRKYDGEMSMYELDVWIINKEQKKELIEKKKLF